jgi:hypothetical protein
MQIIVLLHVSRKEIRRSRSVISCVLNVSTGIEVGGWLPLRGGRCYPGERLPGVQWREKWLRSGEVPTVV